MSHHLEIPVASEPIQLQDVELDVRRFELHCGGQRVRLEKQPMELLILLVEKQGQLVTREEIIDKLWGRDVFVDAERGINNAIRKIRLALKDHSEQPRFVETVVGKGYRFVAPIKLIPYASTGPSVANALTGSSAGPAVAQDHGNAVPITGPPRSRLRYALAGSVLVVLPAVVGILNYSGWRQKFLPKAASLHIQSIAVLPLENLSGDPAQEYFADGMTEALITDLGQIGALRVISRTSAMQYKGTHKSLREIARELNVDAVLEGAVLRSGNRVRITTQLVEVSTDRHLWAQSYERDLVDVLALQDEVARAAAYQVTIKLSPQKRTRLANQRLVNPEAYEAYLKGRYEWNQWTEENLKKSVEYFEQALRKDSAYAPAWAGLSDAYSLLSFFDFLPRHVGVEQSKESALKALELDDTLSEAHVSLGTARLWEWSWSAAEREFQRAIALDPNNAMAHQWYGYILKAQGRFGNAIAEMKLARDLDPLTPNKQQSLGATLYLARQFDEALQLFREIPDLDANSELRHCWMATIYERKGMEREALVELLKALRLGGKKELAASVEQTYLSSGYVEAKKVFLWGDLRETQRRAKGASSPPLALDIAADYALLGERDRAFKWLDEAFREHDGLLMYLKVDDRFEALRSDPRFPNLLRSIGLPL